jgi:Ca-activated chloride channel family protein
MGFQAPLVLLALLALPALAGLYVLGERRRAGREAFAPAALMPSVVSARPGWRRHLPVGLCALALAALIVALARPETTVAVEVDRATIVIATDRSGSMLATDVAPSRLVAARRAAHDFLDAVPDDVRVAAIAFNQTAQVIASPTREHATVAAALDTVEPAGSTATGEAIASALSVIRSARQGGDPERPAPAAIVLLSDGKSVRGRDPLAAADAAEEAGVPVYTVALGTPEGTITTKTGATEPVPPDPATLQEIAERTGAKAFAVADAAELSEVYERLGEQVIEEDRKQQVTAWFAGGALLLLMTGAGTALRWFGRVL